MVSWSNQIQSLRGIATGTAIALALCAGSAVAQDVPGDLWVVNYVKVTGANKDAVRSGLTNAANTYFYGFDTETHMEADVQENGTFNLRVIGPGGKVLARQSGLSYNPNGNVSRSVSASARSWMSGLGCAEGCAVAVSGQAPSPAKTTDVATAAEQAVARVEAEAPKPEVTPESVEIAKPEVPATPITVAEAPTIAKPAVSVPAAPSVTEDVKIAAKPVEAKKPEGLDADLVLARPNVSAAPKASRSTVATPRKPAIVKTPTVPKVQAIAKPNVTAAPSTDTGSAKPATTIAEPKAPVVAAKPGPATVPEVKVVQPTVAPVTTPEVATTTVTEQPVVAEAKPGVTAPAVEQPTDLEVTPGVTLPSPDADATPSTVAEIAEQAKPEVSIITPATPSVPIITTPAPSAVETATEVAKPLVAEVPAPSVPSASDNDGDGEQLALVNPQREVTPAPSIAPTETEVLAPKPEQIETPAEAAKPQETETTTTVETRIAAVDPTAEGPTLANARWVGFTPAVFTGSDNKSGAWISGPFDRKQRTGWITDTATGATTRVTFIWREGGSGSRTALLSREAAKELGLGQGDVANVAVYLPR